MEKPKILVVGSMNMDLFVEGANSIPGFGESIMCGNYGYATGGKGSNPVSYTHLDVYKRQRQV